jgi:hypothetical protein
MYVYQIYALKVEGEGKIFSFPFSPFDLPFPLSFLPSQLWKLAIEKPSTQIHVKARAASSLAQGKLPPLVVVFTHKIKLYPFSSVFSKEL